MGSGGKRREERSSDREQLLGLQPQSSSASPPRSASPAMRWLVGLRLDREGLLWSRGWWLVEEVMRDAGWASTLWANEGVG